jgi:hypothetical protein
MTIKITYRQLTEADAALLALMAVKGLAPADKMLFARTKRALAGDRADIEAERVKLAEKYADIARARLVAEATARAEAITDPALKEQALAAAAKIERPQGVAQPEMPAFMNDFNDLLDQEIDVEVKRIPASKVINDPDFSAEHLFTLDWLLIDDVSPETPAPQPAPAPQQQA